MQDSDMMLFMVYKMLHQKFTAQPTEAEEPEGYVPDHMRDNEKKLKDDKKRQKEEYINMLLADYKEKNRPKPLPLAPVVNPEV